MTPHRIEITDGAPCACLATPVRERDGDGWEITCPLCGAVWRIGLVADADPLGAPKSPGKRRTSPRGATAPPPLDAVVPHASREAASRADSGTVRTGVGIPAGGGTLEQQQRSRLRQGGGP